MTAQTAPTRADLAAEVARLSELVLDQGQAITALERRLLAHEELIRASGRTFEAEPPRSTLYEQEAAWQARRRAMHAVPPLEAAR